MLLRVVPLIVALSCALGCGPDGAGQTSSRVYVVDATPGVDVTVEPDRLVFQLGGHEDLLARLPGDVLVCANGSGFIRGVVSVASADGRITVATTNATLGDAIVEGSVSDSSDMADLQGQWQLDGKYDGVLPFDGMLVIGNTTILGNGRANVDLKDVSVSFKPNVTLDLDVRDSSVTYFKAVAAGAIEARMTVAVETMGNGIWRQDKELWKSTPKTFTQWVGAVPVVEVVQLTFGVGVEVASDGAAKTELGGTVKGTVQAGAIYDTTAGGWRAVGERAVQLIPVAGLSEGELAFDFSLYLYAQLDIMFYDLAGPFLYLAPYVCTSHTVGAPDWSQSFGLYAAWGGQIEVFGNTLAGFEKLLFDYSKDF